MVDTRELRNYLIVLADSELKDTEPSRIVMTRECFACLCLFLADKEGGTECFMFRKFLGIQITVSNIGMTEQVVVWTRKRK